VTARPKFSFDAANATGTAIEERQDFRIGSVPAEHMRPPSVGAAGNAYAFNPRPAAA
jgi:hypothetical protein